MTKSNKLPPPIIDSAKLLAYAYNNDEVEFTDLIDIFVGKKDNLTRLGVMPCLAICSDYAAPNEILLLFCNADWQSKGAIALNSVEKAKAKAERGYRGISKNWKASPYSDGDVENYLRDVYKVDPNLEWWKE